MIFQLLPSGVAPQVRSGAPKQVALPPITASDFRDYQDSRHQSGVSGSSAIDKNSSIYKAAEKIILKEANEFNSLSNALARIQSNDPLYNLANEHLANAALARNESQKAVASFNNAKTVGELDAAVKQFIGIRDAIAGLSNDEVAGTLKSFTSNRALHDRLQNLYSAYQSTASKEFMIDLVTTQLGPKSTVSQVATPPVSPPKVVAVDLSLNSEYESQVQAAKDGKTNAEKQIGLRRSIGQEQALLQTLVDGLAKGDPSITAQVNAIESGKPGFKAAINGLKTKYDAMSADPAQRLALSQSFRETFADFGAVAGQPKLKDNSLAKTITRMEAIVDAALISEDKKNAETAAASKQQQAAQQAEADRQVKLEQQKRVLGAPSPTNITARDEANMWMFENGYAKTTPGDVYFRSTRIPKDRWTSDNDAFSKEQGYTMDYSQADPATAYRATRAVIAAVRVALGEEIPTKDYPEFRDYLAPGAKVLNGIATLGFLVKFKDGREVNEKFLNKNRLTGLLVKLRANEKTFKEYLDQTDQQVQGEGGATKTVSTYKLKDGLTPEKVLAAKARSPQAVLDAKLAIEEARQLTLDAANNLIRTGNTGNYR